MFHFSYHDHSQFYYIITIYADLFKLFLLVEPSLRTLKINLSDAHLSVIVNSYMASIREHSEYIHELLEYGHRLKELCVLKRIKRASKFCYNFFLTARLITNE